VSARTSPFHAGELALQSATGVSGEAARIGRFIAEQIASNASDFIGQQQVAIVATLDPSAQVVCSALVGEPGMFEVVDAITLSVDVRTGILGDALADRTGDGTPIGMLFLDVATRRRYRVNGIVIGADERRILVRVAEAYPNCPKYIQRRALHVTKERSASGDVREGLDLDRRQQQLIAAADTFFIASAGPDGTLDASHRGGRPGFVRIIGDRLWIPDYAGNNMYNTLGNISSNPTTSLLFIDFDSGDTLRLSGRAAIDLDAVDAATGGTDRAWTFTTTSWTRSRLAARLHGELLDMSPYNP
jgi:predicted pyridoxine 5'-phosphate oxidase superfamily flavin-nucleotide-binding protein